MLKRQRNSSRQCLLLFWFKPNASILSLKNYSCFKNEPPLNIPIDRKTSLFSFAQKFSPALSSTGVYIPHPFQFSSSPSPPSKAASAFPRPSNFPPSGFPPPSSRCLPEWREWEPPGAGRGGEGGGSGQPRFQSKIASSRRESLPGWKLKTVARLINLMQQTWVFLLTMDLHLTRRRGPIAEAWVRSQHHPTNFSPP